MSDDVNLVAWAYTDIDDTGGVEMTVSREMAYDHFDMVSYSVREALREHFRRSDARQVGDAYFVVMESSPLSPEPFKILKEGTL